MLGSNPAHELAAVSRDLVRGVPAELVVVLKRIDERHERSFDALTQSISELIDWTGKPCSRRRVAKGLAEAGEALVQPLKGPSAVGERVAPFVLVARMLAGRFVEEDVYVLEEFTDRRANARNGFAARRAWKYAEQFERTRLSSRSASMSPLSPSTWARSWR